MAEQKKFNPEKLIKPVGWVEEETDEIEEAEIVEDYQLVQPIMTKEWSIVESPTNNDIKILNLYADINTPVASIKLDKILVKAINETTNYVNPKKRSLWGPLAVLSLGGIMFGIVFLGSALSNFSGF